MERIIPDAMKPEAKEEEVAGLTTQTARFENVDLDLCPVCQTPLRRSCANNVPVMVCDTHSIAMPVKDSK